MAKRLDIDIGFLHRTYKTTLIIGGLVTLILCAMANAKWVLNYGLGVLTMVGVFKVTEIFVTQAYRAPHEEKPKRRYGTVLMVSKYGGLIVGLYLLNRLRYFDGLAFFAGLATLHTVLVLKVLGLMLQNLWQDTMRTR